MSEQNAWVENVDYGRIVDFATQSVELLGRSTAPKSNVEYFDAALQ